MTALDPTPPPTAARAPAPGAPAFDPVRLASAGEAPSVASCAALHDDVMREAGGIEAEFARVKRLPVDPMTKRRLLNDLRARIVALAARVADVIAACSGKELLTGRHERNLDYLRRKLADAEGAVEKELADNAAGINGVGALGLGLLLWPFAKLGELMNGRTPVGAP